MPANRRSLAITEAHRNRLRAIVARAERETRFRWPAIEDFDSLSEPWLVSTSVAVKGAQTEAVRAAAAYLGAYLTSELGRRGAPPRFDSRAYAGVNRAGRPLVEALQSPLIGVRAALKGGKSPVAALQLGLDRAVRMVELDTMTAGRQALRDLMEADPHVRGWQRSVRGTCGACSGDIEVEVRVELPSVPLSVHPFCQCVTVPVAVGVSDRFPLPTGRQIFEGMSPEAQDKQFGLEKAKALRSGEINLRELVGTSVLATEPDFITETPLKEVDPAMGRSGRDG